MKEKERLKIKVVDEKTGAAFEAGVNEAIEAIETGGGKILGIDVKVELFRAAIRYRTTVLEPENLMERLMMAGEHPTCGGCALCEHYEDKRKAPRCRCFGFRVKDSRPACEEYAREEGADGVPEREAG